MTDFDIQHARVLKWVNRIRKEYLGKGPIKRMPRGRLKDPRACPLHNALWKECTGGKVYNGSIQEIFGGCSGISTPGFITVWQENFDAGKYPELIKE